MIEISGRVAPTGQVLPLPATQPRCGFSPTNGSVLHEPAPVEVLRRDRFYAGGWQFNPWNGQRRAYNDVEADPQCRGVWCADWGPMPVQENAMGHVPESQPCAINNVSKSIEADPTGRGAHDAGAKLDAGKTRVWLCVSGFSQALEQVALVTTKGAEKYAPNSWMEVPDGESRYLEAAARHLLEIGKGNVVDDGPGGTECLHLAQVAWNVLASLELQLRHGDVRKTP